MRLVFAIAGDERKMRPGLVLILLLASLLPGGAAERAAAVSEALIAEQETIRVKGSVSDLGTFCRG